MSAVEATATATNDEEQWLSESKDYQLLQGCLKVLKAQQQQTLQDIDYLEFAKQEALKDPVGFLALLKSKESRLMFPQLQKVVQVPAIDFTRFPGPLISEAQLIPKILVKPESFYKDAPYAELKADLGLNTTKPPTLPKDHHPSIDGPHNLTTTLMDKLKFAASAPRTEESIKHAVQGLRPKSYVVIGSAEDPDFNGQDGTEHTAKKKKYVKKNPLKSRSLQNINRDKVQYLPLSVRISGANYLRKKAEINQTQLREADEEPSSEDDIDPEMKESEEYKELMKLKKLYKQKQNYIPQLNRGEAVHHGFSCDACLCNPIIGLRHLCIECPEEHQIDLCSDCVGLSFENDVHKASHKFKVLEVAEPDPYGQDADPYAYLGI